jgi:glycosyltransferase involved in cell wall biosynthesis
MPTYRQGEHIWDAFEGLHSQLFRRFEVIVVFDGDSEGDEVFPPAKNWHAVYHPSNRGTAAALNTGFAKALGTYWTWVSSDNVMHPDWLSTLVTHLTTHPGMDMVYSSYVREWGRIAGGQWHVQRRRAHIQPPLKSVLDFGRCYVGPSFLYHRRLHDAVGPHRGRRAHDGDWWMRAEELTTFGWVQDILATYRSHATPEQRRVCLATEGDSCNWRAEARRRRAHA